MKNNLWGGQLLSDDDFKKHLVDHANNTVLWAKNPLNHHTLFLALEKIRIQLLEKNHFYEKLLKDLESRDDMTPVDRLSSLSSLTDFLNPENQRIKLKRELGSDFPFELKRISFKENHFESWYPLGVLVHVTPNNSPLLSVFATIEGLLSGNINVLKLARKDSAFAAIFFHELCKCDETQLLKDYIYIGRISSGDKEILKTFLSLADVISAWGNEESLVGLKELAPKSARFVEWGHKISFSFVSKKQSHDKKMFDALAFEICNNEQMACSSPQCVFVEDASFQELKIFSKNLAESLEKISPTIIAITPTDDQRAELTVTEEKVRLNSILGKSDILSSPKKEWRILIEDNSVIKASPLFRTIWVKPMPKDKIVEHLRPLKFYLQTVGLSAEADELADLARKLFLAGVQRIRSIGEMTDSYLGEPHDGVYALTRFCQRISFSDSEKNPLMKLRNSFEEKEQNIIQSKERIMEKSDFQNFKIEEKFSDLFFYSGGSSGEPKLSVFTYDDYHRQMELAAEGLFAAGLDSRKDRVMNLFYAGNLYGGFVSFFTVLEIMKAKHFPMGAHTDFSLVGKTIVENNVDTLLGMPSYLMQLFSINSELFKTYKGIKKIFYGGEHFSESQRQYFIKNFGVEVIRSASYGSVDAGPLGFQCEYSTGGIHHLHERLHALEVVDLENDIPVKSGEVGRFLFTSKVRSGQKIHRYAIGDVGRIVEGRCPCHREGIRFELLGRHGDVFRIGATFLSYQRFQKILTDEFNFEGSFQLHLHPGIESSQESVVMLIENKFPSPIKADAIKQRITTLYKDLNESTAIENVLKFEVKLVLRDELIFSSTTKKLRSVIDYRQK